MFWHRVFVLALACCGFAVESLGQPIEISTTEKRIFAAQGISYLPDSLSEFNIKEVARSQQFQPCSKSILNLGIVKGTYWLRIPMVNKTADNIFSLDFDRSDINYIEMFYTDSVGNYVSTQPMGTDFAFEERNVQTPTFVFHVKIPPGKEATFFFRVKHNGPLVMPVYIQSEPVLQNFNILRFTYFGLYAGILIALLLYNIFLMFSFGEYKSYIWYILHTLFIGLTQISFLGYSFQYFWPHMPEFSKMSFPLFTCLVSMTGIEFGKSFINTKANTPVLHKGFWLFHTLYAVILALTISGQHKYAYSLLEPVQGSVALYLMGITIYLAFFKGMREAKFYFISWFVLFAGIIVFIMKDEGAVPYNTVTSHILLIGSATQIILLSIAVADRINILKIEKQRSQEETLAALRENERMVREQNIILEEKVTTRTAELAQSNSQLQDALVSLKETQSQLVEKEKMSSLGQLTAGIAHEINNPINFVTSNISPLKRDVMMVMDLASQVESIAFSDEPADSKQSKIKSLKDELDYDYLKTEIDFLLKGIGDGAHRTAEIVKGLRIFSRVDEDALKKADIHEGLDSTLVLLSNQVGSKITIEKKYEATDPYLTCYPGKLNQVFMNILSNAIYAVRDHWQQNAGGKITVQTATKDNMFYIKIADNGIGMSEETLQRVFEPFYTTKPVGEGTGLGMSIGYKIVESHGGKIKVESEVGKGTTFTIEIPVKE